MAESVFARFRLQRSDEGADIFCLHARMHRQHQRKDTNAPDRREITQRIIRQAAIKCRVDRLGRAGGEEEAVAIRPRTRRRHRADIAIGATTIFDHHRLAKIAPEVIGQDARHAIRATTGGKGDDGGDGPFGPGGQAWGGERHKRTDDPAKKTHASSPSTCAVDPRRFVEGMLRCCGALVQPPARLDRVSLPAKAFCFASKDA